MDDRLLAATRIDGSPRFFPPGSHPATHRYRVHLAYLRHIEESVRVQIENYRPRVLVSGHILSFKPDPKLAELYDTLRRCRETILHIEETLAVFEQGESEDKARYLMMVRRQEEDDGA